MDSPGRVVALDLSHPTTARPLVMEGPAAAIWHALAQPSTLAQVAARVAAGFGVPAAEVDTDVRAFLGELETLGLIRQSAAERHDTGPDPSSPCS